MMRSAAMGGTGENIQLAMALADVFGGQIDFNSSLQPGDAYLYEPGVLHSPRRDGSTRLLRIEGLNMDRVKRLPYVAVTEAISA